MNRRCIDSEKLKIYQASAGTIFSGQNKQLALYSTLLRMNGFEVIDIYSDSDIIFVVYGASFLSNSVQSLQRLIEVKYIRKPEIRVSL